MAETNLFIVRHGETDLNRDGILQGRGIDASLNTTGRRQAVQVSEYLESTNIDQIITSSLKRSKQTADPIVDFHQIEGRSYPELDEMHFGELEGEPVTDVKDSLNEIHAIWSRGDVDYSIPGGESPQAVFKRADGAVQSILKQSEGESLVMILHGRLIRILLSVWLGHGLKNMHLIHHQNGAINHLKFLNGIFSGHKLNYTEHLSE